MRISRRAIALACVTMSAACSTGGPNQAEGKSASAAGEEGNVSSKTASAGKSGSAAGKAGTGRASNDAGGSTDRPGPRPDGGPAAGSGGSTAGAGSGGPSAGTTAPPSAALDWPMFGRDYANSRASSDVSIDAQQVASLHVVQRVTGAGVSSTPAIVDGVVYYSDYAGWLKAVDARTSAVVWSKRLQNGMLTPSPFVTADTVYIAGDASNVYAVNRSTGALRWTTKIESTPSNRIWSSPIVVGDTLIIGAGSYQVFIPATPTFRGSIVGLGASDGKEKWRFSVCPEPECGGGVSVWSSVAVDPALKLAYIGTGQAYYAPAGPYSDSIVALNYETGAHVWHHQLTANDVYNIDSGDGTRDRDVGAPPNLFEVNIGGTSRKLVGVGDKGGRYTVFDRETGAQIWQALTDPRKPPGSPIGGVMGAPAVANGRIFLTNNTSTMGTGRFDARPGNCSALALDAATGNIVWTSSLPAGSFSGNTVANGLMYFVTYDGQLRVLDTMDGKLVKSVALGAMPGGYVGEPTDGFPDGSTSGPIVANGRIYAGYGWTWGASVTGGLAILEVDAGAASWSAECPNGFVPMPGVNTAFPTPTGMRSFSLNLPADTSTPRPVWVPLTGSVESTNENLDARGGNRKLTSSGAIVIGPVRRCAGSVDGGGTADNGGTCNMAGSGGWNWSPWNEGRAFGAAGDPWKTDEGPDSKFFEAIIKCVATKWPVDQRRLFIGGISSGGTMTNRALTFRSDFWAGGMPISGEWYVTRDDGTSWGSDDFSARVAAVKNAPTKTFQGRVGPFPLKTSLDPMIVISVWGGENDLWNCSNVLCADYRPTTQVASNYFSAMPNVVHVACSSTHGHQWPTINRDAFNLWALTTLTSHPKGTPKSAFKLTPPPSGYNCQVGVFTDHY